MSELAWTGERLVIEIDGVWGVAEHLHRYALAAEYVKGKIVLDIASGEGYGSNILSTTAASVTGVDIDEQSVKHALSKYSSKNNKVTYKHGSATKIPLESKSVDVVVSFETLEHITEQDEMLKEITRVLKDDGMLIMSTPDTVIYKPHDPDNQYHVKELTTDEFVSLINRYFKHSKFYNQRCVTGTLILPINQPADNFKIYTGSYEGVKDGYAQHDFYGTARFNIAFASNNNSVLEKINISSHFNFVPELLNEFRGSIGLMFELKETKKLADRLHEIEKSKSYRLAQQISKLFGFFK
jgi:2-polyprenyl-3-methyl-5-hydroxy-6-metoxy-1,4-benzoquinol methylase